MGICVLKIQPYYLPDRKVLSYLWKEERDVQQIRFGLTLSPNGIRGGGIKNSSCHQKGDCSCVSDGYLQYSLHLHFGRGHGGDTERSTKL